MKCKNCGFEKYLHKVHSIMSCKQFIPSEKLPYKTYTDPKLEELTK